MKSITLYNVGERAEKVTIDSLASARSSIELEDAVDCAELTVFPGFIDVHCHGAVGIDVNEADADGLIEVGRFLAEQGVTAWLPTLVPDSDERYAAVVDAVDQAIGLQAGLPVAQIVGVHYEGVFANEKMCGALRPEFFKVGSRESGVGSRELAASLPKLKKGVHMTTMAPEIEGGSAIIEALVADGWIVSIGHTRADIETLDRAFAAGARHVTHFFNAMTGIHHREVGVAGWGLANDGVTFDMIADGIHVHPSMIKMACRAKTTEKVALISDSVAPTGLGDGEFQLWGETVTVKNGRTQNERGSIAGSVCSMLDCVKTMRALGFSDLEVASMAATVPARLLGLEDRGAIEVGKRGDIVGIDRNGDFAFTLIGGTITEVLFK